MQIILNTYGAALSRTNNQFVLTQGEHKQHIAADAVKSIVVNKGTVVTSDAILLAIEQQIDMLFNNKQGEPQGRIWSVQYGSISNIRKCQLEFIYSPSIVPWAKQLLIEKINNQIAILLAHPQTELPQANVVKHAINSIQDYVSKINKAEAELLQDIAPTLRGWEGQASRKYFEAISSFLPNAYKFAKRTRMPALDVFNAMLNYGYGILYGKVEGALIKAGLDPYLGIFHRDDYNRPALVFDVIERYRHWVDYVMINIAQQEVIDTECIETDTTTGAIYFKAIGKRIIIQAVNDYLAEIVPYKNIERSRATIIEQDAFTLAKTFTNDK